jgi:nicotinamide riboside kinase
MSGTDTATRGPGPALCVAIVGAESTGKSTLAGALADALAQEFGLRVARVDETLREWCDRHARTPRADEQSGIATEHAWRIAVAAARPDIDVLLCDTTPLMVAVYSDLLFGDRSLLPLAAACQRRMDATLLTALDLPWVADGLQRDGPHVRAPVDALVRENLLAWGVEWAVISGFGAARTTQALATLRPMLSTWCRSADRPAGLFAALQSAQVGPRRIAPLRCERCEDGPDRTG